MPSNKQRRDAERRRLQRQLARRHEREAQRRKVTLITSIGLTVVLIAAIVVAVVGLSSGDDPKPAAKGSSTPTSAGSSSPAVTSPAPSTSTATKAAYPCTWGTPTGTVTARKVTKPATTKPPKTGKVTVAVTTNRGPMTLTLDRAAAPCTVASFVSLVQQKFYDKTPCHRLTTSGIYVLQCGDPTSSGSGGPGYTVPDEATGKETYPAGTIAMARGRTADSGGSQFFIVYKDSPNLVQNLGTLQYTVFGTVSKGLGVVTKVAAGGSNNKNGPGDGAPKLKLEIDAMKQSA